MPDLRGLLADPEFNALPLERRQAILTRINPQLAAEYVATRQGQPVAAAAPEPPAPASPWQERSASGILRNAGQSMLGAVKAAAQTAYESNPVTMGSRLAQRVIGGEAPQGEAEMLAALQPANEAQGVGRQAERMLEFAAPGGPARGVVGAAFQGARGAGTTLLQGGTPREALVAGAISAGGPLTAKLAEVAAPGIRKLAVAQYERALAATTKATSGRITPELLDRGVVGTLENLAKKGATKSAPVGRALNEAYEGATKAGVEVPTGPIIARLGKLKQKYLVRNKAGETFSANPGAMARIEAVEELVGKFGDTAPPDQLWRLRQQIDDIITSTGTGFADIKPGTAKWLQRNARTAIQKELNKTNPDLVKLNAEFSLWKGLEDVAKATVERKRGQTGVLELGIRGAAGTTVGYMFSDDPRWAGVGGLLGAATKHPLWRTTSAASKAHLAHAMSKGNAATATSILSRLLAGWSASGPSAPEPSPTPGARP